MFKQPALRTITVVNEVIYQINMVYSLSRKDYDDMNRRYKESDDFTDELFERSGMARVEIVNSQEFPDPNQPDHIMIAQTWEARVPSHRWSDFNKWVESLSNTPTRGRGPIRKWLDNKLFDFVPEDKPFEIG